MPEWFAVLTTESLTWAVHLCIISIDFDAIVSPVLRFKIRVWIGLPAFINVWLSLVEPH